MEDKMEPEQKKLTLDELKADRARNHTFSIAIVAIVIGGLGIVLFLTLGRKSDTPRRMPSENFPAHDYVNQPNSFVGNRFSAALTVDSQLGFNAAKGRLMAMRDKQNNKLIPVLIPPDIDTTFHKGQEYVIGIHVTEDGLIVAESLTKK